MWFRVLLAVLTLLVYWNVWNFEFVNFDDNNYVYDNPRVNAGLSAASIKWAWTTSSISNWHPFVWMSLMADVELSGRGPAGFHRTNLLLHVANTLLLFELLRRLTRRDGASFFVAAVFAIHPLHVESVAWISSRKDVLSTCFGLLSMLAWVRYVRCRRWLPYVGALVLFACSLLSKQMLVTLPCLLLVLDGWPLGRWKRSTQSSHADMPSDTASTLVATTNNDSCGFTPDVPCRPLILLIAEKLPFLALSLAFSMVAMYVQNAGGAMRSLDQIPVGARVANSVIAYGDYLRLSFLPVRLAVFYPHPEHAVDMSRAWLCGGILAAITVMALLLVRRIPAVLVGWLWFLGTLVPVIGLVQVGIQQRADRYMYFPLAGLGIAVAWGFPALLRRARLSPKMSVTLAALCIMLCMVTARMQVLVWRNAFTLWSHASQVTTSNYWAETQLANVLHDAGQAQAAQEHYRLALAIKPGFASANLNLGLLIAADGDHIQAMRYYQTALENRSPYPAAWFCLGKSHQALGEFQQAEDCFTRAVSESPEFEVAWLARGELAEVQRQFKTAREMYDSAVRINPESTALAALKRLDDDPVGSSGQ